MKIRMAAFTILEALFTLVISAIVISVVYVTYANFSKQTHRFFYDAIEASEVHSFYSQMNLDIYNAQEAFMNSKDLVLKYANGEKIVYRKKRDRLYRYQSDLNTNQIFSKEFKTKEILQKNKKRVFEVYFKSKIYQEDIEFSIIKNHLSPVKYGY